MEVAQSTAAPAGFLDFCRREPRECAATGGRAPVALTTQRMEELRSINGAVNASVREVADAAQYGVAEHWALPRGGVGDCEDFALLKRRLLIQHGWPSSALLVTTARTESGEGHAVLTVVTDQGDYVLDNRTSAVRLWSDTGYVFFARQDMANPRRWVVVDLQRRVAMARGANYR